MNQWKKLDLFCKIAKKHIVELNEVDLEYNLLKYQIDDNGPCCSDSQLLNAFKNVINIDENKLYKIIENICLEYVNKIKGA